MMTKHHRHLIIRPCWRTGKVDRRVGKGWAAPKLFLIIGVEEARRLIRKAAGEAIFLGAEFAKDYICGMARLSRGRSVGLLIVAKTSEVL
jgi:hypothetical protein